MASVTSDFFDIWTSPDTTQDIIQLTSKDVESSSHKIPYINQNEDNVLSSTCEISSSVQDMGLIGEILNENQFLNYTPRSHSHDIYNNLILSSCQSDPNIFWNDTTPAPSLNVQMNTGNPSGISHTGENEEIIVNVNHEPLVATTTTSIPGMDTYLLDDIPTHGVSSSLDEINLDDVFQGWGENMHHLLWKITNPMVDISTPEVIDVNDMEKLRRSLNGPFTRHQIAYLNALLPVQVQGVAEPVMPMTRSDPSLVQLLPMPMPRLVMHPENSRHLPRILSVSSKPKPINTNNSISPTSPQSLLNNIFMDNINCYTSSKELPSPPQNQNQFQNLLPNLDSVELLPQKKFWETKCDICGLILLGGRQRFEAHVKNAHELKCICGMDFKFKIKLMNHIKSMTSESQNNECNPDELVKHHGITPGDKIKPLFECDYCDEIFRNRNAAVKHRNQVHLPFVESSEDKVESTCSSGSKKIRKIQDKEEKVRKKGERKSKLPSAGSASTNSYCTYDNNTDNLISGSDADFPNSGRKHRKRTRVDHQLTSNTKDLIRNPNSKESVIHCVVPNFNVNLNVNSQNGMCGGSVSINNSLNKHSSVVPIPENDKESQQPLNIYQSSNSDSFPNSHGFGLPDSSICSSMIVANINTLAVAPRPAKKPKKIREAPRKRLKMTKDRTSDINLDEVNTLFLSNKPAGWIHCPHLAHDSEMDHRFVL